MQNAWPPAIVIGVVFLFGIILGIFLGACCITAWRANKTVMPLLLPETFHHQ